jgi:hypothetical protein
LRGKTQVLGAQNLGIGWRVRQDELEEKVLKMLERDVLSPDRVAKALKQAYALAKARLKKDPTVK